MAASGRWGSGARLLGLWLGQRRSGTRHDGVEGLHWTCEQKQQRQDRKLHGGGAGLQVTHERPWRNGSGVGFSMRRDPRP